MRQVPTLSVIIPVHNSAQSLPRLFASLQDQTLTSFEAIFIDDFSTDASWDMLCDVSMRDTRFRVHRLQKNLGAGCARNKGIELASGTFIHFLDSDDCYASSKALERMIDYIEKSRAEVTVFRYNLISSEHTSFRRSVNAYEQKVWNYLTQTAKVDNSSYHNIKDTQYLLALPAFPWNKIYTRDFLLAHTIRFFQTMLHNDIFFTWKSLLLAERISFCSEPVVNYYYSYANAAQASNQKDARRFELFAVFDELDTFVHTIAADHSFSPWLLRFKIDTFSFGLGKIGTKQLSSFSAAVKQALSGISKASWKELKHLPLTGPVDRCKHFFIRFLPLFYAYALRLLKKIIAIMR
jgi:glycosyltransferase involved in cell wall biosynthesis